MNTNSGNEQSEIINQTETPNQPETTPIPVRSNDTVNQIIKCVILAILVIIIINPPEISFGKKV